MSALFDTPDSASGVGDPSSSSAALPAETSSCSRNSSVSSTDPVSPPNLGVRKVLRDGSAKRNRENKSVSWAPGVVHRSRSPGHDPCTSQSQAISSPEFNSMFVNLMKLVESQQAQLSQQSQALASLLNSRDNVGAQSVGSASPLIQRPMSQGKVLLRRPM